MVPRPSDEHPHEAPPGDGGWSETWTFDFATADGELGGWVRFTRLTDRAWYEAMLTGPHRQLLAVIDHDVPFRSNPLEVRTTGLWADHVCETPMDHWTLGLEAFALGVDDPLELHGRQLGDQVALGFDLEWETDGPVLDLAGGPGVVGYELSCEVHGEVLVGRDVIDLAGVGSRAHQWGPVDWWADGGWHLTGVLDGRRRWSVSQRGETTTATIVGRDGRARTVDAVALLEVDEHGVPAGARVDADGEVLHVEVLAATPLPRRWQGRESRHPRALCRHRTGDGWIGVGWLEVLGGARPGIPTGHRGG